MHPRRRFALASTATRTLLRAAGFAIVVVAVGLTNSFDPRYLLVGVVLVIAVAAWSALGEGYQRRKLAQEVGWLRDPDVLAVVAADVDSGRTPTENAEVRELARRYAVVKTRQTRTLPAFSLVLVALDVTLLVSALRTGGDDLGGVVVLVLLALGLLFQGWVVRPRYHRIMDTLGDTEQAWAAKI